MKFDKGDSIMAFDTQKFVIDTSAFTAIGDSSEEINENINEMIDLIAKGKEANIRCYVPPSVWDETEKMLKKKDIPQEQINKLNSWLIQKSPNKTELRVPADFIYQYVGEVRQNINKGLREAEKAVKRTEEEPEPASEIISDLRDKYRRALRQGILDSKEDLSILLLAKELDGGIVAKDAGIEDWAKEWGIRYLSAEAFPSLVREHLERNEED